MPLVWDALLHASPASRRRPGSRCWSLGKSRSTRFHAPKLPPARGGEREWSCLSLHRVVVLALFPRLLPPNANVPHSPSHAKGRESGHASPCISQTTRPWSIGNRITRWAPERGAREAAANGPRGLAPPTKSPHATPRMLLPSPSNAGFRFPRALAPRPVSPAPSHRIEKTPTQFAAAARHRTPHRTRRGERVDMPLPTSLKFALLLQPPPCRLRHALTFRQGWSSLQRRGSGTAAPRQGPPSNAESAPREKTPRPRPPNRNPPPTVCVHHFTPWNRCESAPLPTQSQPSTVVSPYSESSPILLSGAPASSNGPHPDRRPHNARFCHPLVFCVRSFLRTSGGLERPPSLSSERLPPAFETTRPTLRQSPLLTGENPPRE